MLTIEFKTTAGNKRRELTQQVVQQQLKEAGFDITINNVKAGDFFGQILPAGDRKKLAYLLGKPFDVTEVLEVVQATVGNPYV